MNLQETQDEINFIAVKVDQFILSNIFGNPRHLYDASLHYIKSGGKRLRPFMSVKSSQLFGGDLEKSLPAASSVELIHNFTLVHDDIMDNDDLRHGVSTVHKEFGTPVAILSGDILFSKAFQIMVGHGRTAGIGDKTLIEMVSTLSSACIEICEGQALDIKMSKDSEFSSTDDYMNMIEKKTAALFGVSCELGTLSSPNHNYNDVKKLSEFGKKIGIAFQLIDDLIGINGDPKVTGKSVGNDIREGKKTLPILLAMQNLDSNSRNTLKEYFGKNNITDGDLKQIVSRISMVGIDKEIRQIAQTFIDDASDILKNYDDRREVVMSLENSARYVVERSL